MSLYRAEGIILRNKDLGEADKIVTIFTRTHGKVRAVAKGARRPRNRLTGPTQVFSYSDFLFFSGKNLDTISQAYLKESFIKLRDDLVRMASASYVVELIDLLIEEKEKNEDLFLLLHSVMGLLCFQKDLRTVLRFYELNLMDILGYRPHLDSCVKCAGPIDTGKHGFSPSQGGAICYKCIDDFSDAIPMSSGAIASMSHLLGIETDKVGVLRISPGIHSEMSIAAKKYVQYRVDRQIKSLQFLELLI
jgi:DNA repair protein RecO (recombination protein O)